MYGLFIGTTVSSIVLFIFRIFPVTAMGMIAILYLYSIVGGATAIFIHRKLERDLQKRPTRKNYIEKNERDGEFIDVELILERVGEVRVMLSLLKKLLETRKELEKLKKEGNSILEDISKKMEERLTANY